MSARAVVGVGRLADAARQHLVEAGHRRGGVVAPCRALVLMLAVAAVAVVTLMARAFGGRVLTGVALAVLAGFRALPFRMPSYRTLLRGRVRLFARPGDSLADQLLDRRDASAVGGRDDGDGGAAASGASGAADAMDVIVGMVRDVEVEDVADGGNVEAARGDVGGNQQRDFVLAELIERGHARRLVHVAVQRDRGKAVAHERTMQRRDLALAVAEDDRVGQALGRADDAAQRVALVVRLAAGPDQQLGGGGDGGGRTRDLDLHGIVQELLGDAPDLRRHGGGEEQRLTREWNKLADALDVGNETHVEHAVGFVDHQQLDAGEQEPSALEMVEQATWGRNENVDAAGELRILVVERDAADQQRDVELLTGAVLFEAFLNLRGELA